ncbi:MAG: ankyrin repeat domain-containing protein [Pseudomonadota bacterium]
MGDSLFFEQPDINSLLEACHDGNLKKVSEILDQNSDVNHATHSGSAALHIAAQNGYLDLVNFLLSRGADVNLLTSDGWTALHFAAQRGYVDVVNVLIKAGVKVDIAGLRYQRTALHYAADQGRADVVRALLAAGANPNLLDISGDNALAIANKKSHLETAQLLEPVS